MMVFRAASPQLFRVANPQYPVLPVWGEVELRVLVYHPVREPEGLMRLVVQKVDPTHGPVAEAPLLEALVQEHEVEAYLKESREDGWIFQEEPPIDGDRPPIAHTHARTH